MDVVALGAQTTGFVLWPLLEKERSPTELLVIPITLFLVSCGYWENYVTKHSLFGEFQWYLGAGFVKWCTSFSHVWAKSIAGLLRPVWRIKDKLKRTRYFSYLFISIWKIICFFCCMVLFTFLKGGNIAHLFSMFSAGFSQHRVHVVEVGTLRYSVSRKVRTSFGIPQCQLLKIFVVNCADQAIGEWPHFTRSGRYCDDWRIDRYRRWSQHHRVHSNDADYLFLFMLHLWWVNRTFNQTDACTEYLSPRFYGSEKYLIKWKLDVWFVRMCTPSSSVSEFHFLLLCYIITFFFQVNSRAKSWFKGSAMPSL